MPADTDGRATGAGRRWRLTGWGYWILLAGLVLAVALGVARVYRVSVLTAPITAGTSDTAEFSAALEQTRRVAARFSYIEQHGAVSEAAPWPLRTAADYLLTGGDCGHAALALGSAFTASRRPFRLVQINVGPAGAGHILIETRDDMGRWVLLDALGGAGFAHPRDGRLLGIDEIRALAEGEREWLAPEYRADGPYSLFAPYRRTNWAKLGPLTLMIAAVEGDAWMRETSLRPMTLAAELPLTQAGIALILLLLITRIVGRGRILWPRRS